MCVCVCVCMSGCVNECGVGVISDHYSDVLVQKESPHLLEFRECSVLLLPHHLLPSLTPNYHTSTLLTATPLLIQVVTHLPGKGSHQ